MKIEFVKVQSDKFEDRNQYEIRMIGRLDECDIIINALENSVQDSPSVRDATAFLRKKHSALKQGR